MLLASCGGCWEEIHYQGAAEPAAAPAAESPTVEAPPDVETPPVESSAVDDGSAQPIAADPPVVAETAPPAEPVAEAEAPTSPPSDASAEAPTSDELFSGDADAGDEPAPATEAASSDAAAPSTSEDVAEAVLPTPDEPELAADPSNDTEALAAEPPTQAQRRQAWQAASKWSLAAAIYAKGLPVARYQPILDEANAAANEVDVELPPLPTASAPTDLEATVIEALRGEAAVKVGNSLGAKFGPAEAAAADLAIRSHLLLLTYSPRGADAPLQAAALRQAGERSQLPAERWEPVVNLVEQKAPFAEVRQAVFDLHRGVDAELAE